MSLNVRIAFRVDASAGIGGGHLKRCISLADELTSHGASCLFVCREIPITLQAELKDRGHHLRRLKSANDSPPIGDLEHSAWLGADQLKDANETVSSISGSTWDWIVVDHYAIDFQWQSVVRLCVQQVMVIDDLADRAHECDLLLDQNLVEDMYERYADRVPSSCRLLLGPRYALLDRSFVQYRDRVELRVKIKRILIYFGGVDKDDLTYRTLKIVLSKVSAEIRVDVVLPSPIDSSPKIEELAALHGNLTCYRNLPTLAPLIASADLSIGAMGSTTWERLCLGLPTIAIITATNQRRVAMGLNMSGAVILLGDSATVTDDEIKASLQNVLEKNSLTAWSEHCQKLCDGKGARRVVEEMLGSGIKAG